MSGFDCNGPGRAYRTQSANAKLHGDTQPIMVHMAFGAYEALVRQLGIPHRAGNAYRLLIGKGLDALPAVRDGLRSENADVRFRCCQLLDRFPTPQVFDLLIGMLDDLDRRVRCATLHSLACDRCKKASCRPDKAKALPRAIAILENDSDPHVRAMAVEVIGQWVHTHPKAETALVQASRADASATVRKKAGWYVPGGPIHRRTASQARRLQSDRGVTRR